MSAVCEIFQFTCLGISSAASERVLFLCGKKWQGSLERKSKMSQVKGWVSRTTSDG